MQWRGNMPIDSVPALIERLEQDHLLEPEQREEILTTLGPKLSEPRAAGRAGAVRLADAVPGQPGVAGPRRRPGAGAIMCFWKDWARAAWARSLRPAIG